MLTTGILVKTK